MHIMHGHISAVGMCPATIVVHPRTAEPLQCQVNADCMSATCDINTTATSLTLSPPTLQGSVSFQLHPCNTASRPVQLVLSGSLPRSSLGVFDNVPVTGLGQVEIQQGGQVVGYIRVLDLILGWSQANDEALYIAIEVSCLILLFMLLLW